MIKLENVSYKVNNKYILKDINLEIEDKEFVVLTGQNGSGKTTLLKIIMGLIKPTTGKIYFNNKDITNMSINDRNELGISFAYQIPVTFKGITIHELFSISKGNYVTFDETKDVLSKVGLCARNYIQRNFSSELSGGELKRLEIATILIKNNDFLMFDEPEAGIDLWAYKDLIQTFKDLKRKHKTILIISHQEKMLAISDRVIILNKGELEKEKNKKIVLTNLKLKKIVKKCGGNYCE